MHIVRTPSFGFVLVLGIASLSLLLGSYAPMVGSAIFALVIGILLNNLCRLPGAYQTSLRLSSKKGLQYAIVLLGFSLSFQNIRKVGASSLWLTLVTIVVAFLAAYLALRLLKLPWRLGVLVGFGTAICGGSAIAAASPILEADDEEIALSMSTIFLFNLVAVFLFPLFGRLLHLDDWHFGLWAGTAINDTSSVVAAAYSFSPEAGDTATIVKLVRALMIVPSCLVFLFGKLLFARKEATLQTSTNVKETDEATQTPEKRGSVLSTLRRIFPWFILFFVLASTVSTLGWVPLIALSFIKKLSQFLMAMALASIGLQVSFGKLKAAGLKPFLAGAMTWVAVALSSLVIQKFWL